MAEPALLGPPLLSDAQVASYLEAGYLVVPNVVTLAEVEEMRAEQAEVCAGNRGEVRGLEPLEGETPDEATWRYLSIHEAHTLSPPLRRIVAQHERTNRIIQQLMLAQRGSANVKFTSSIMFMKAPGMEGQPWHQVRPAAPACPRSPHPHWGCWRSTGRHVTS